MAETIKRGMTVEVDVKGAARADAAIAKTGNEIEKAGAKGSAGLAKIDAGSKKASEAVGGLSQKMANALDPIDKAFAGTDRLMSIVGKFTAVIGLASLAWAGISRLMQAFEEDSKDSEDATKRQTERFAELRDMIKEYSGALSVVQTQELVRGNEDLTNAISQAAKATENAIRWEEERQSLIRGMSSTNSELLKEQSASISSLERSIEGAQKTAEMWNGEVTRSTLAVRALTEEAVRSATAVTDVFGPEDAPGGAAVRVKAVAESFDEVTEAIKRSQEYATPWADMMGEALGEIADARNADALAIALQVDEEQRLIDIETRLDSIRKRFSLTRAKDAAKAEKEIEAEAKARRAAISANIDGTMMMAEALEGAGASASIVEGLQMTARMVQAGADAVDYAAESAAAFAKGNAFTGAGLAAAAVAKGISAATYAAGLAKIGQGGGASAPAAPSGGGTPSASPASAQAAGRSGASERGESSVTIVVNTGTLLGTTDQVENAIHRGYTRASGREDGPRSMRIR